MNPVIGVIFTVICGGVFVYSIYSLIKRRRDRANPQNQDKANSV